MGRKLTFEIKIIFILTVCCFWTVYGTGISNHLRTIPKENQYVDGEFLLALNNEELPTRNHENLFINILTNNFGIKIIRFFHIGSLKLLHIKGNEADIQLVLELDEVRYVEYNSYTFLAQCAEQPAPESWGLDRIDQRTKLASPDPLNPNATYIFGNNIGTDVYVYVLDTGIDIFHPEFEGRAIWGYTSEGLIGPTEDLDGHGTHCAGIIGSSSYGVAKNVTLVAVKVVDGFVTPWATFIEGLEWILSDHESRGPDARSIINISQGSICCNQALEDSVQALIDAGVTVVVAAVNNDDDACLYLPAGIPDAITVGASNVTDTTASFSNWGSCVDIYAPGVSIKSTIPIVYGGTFTVSGTSMAAPYVAGVIARYMSSLPSPVSPADVDTWLKSQATPDALTYMPGHETSPNLLLYAECP